MGTYIMLTKLSPEAIRDTKDFEELNRRVEERIRRECPDIKWIGNYAVMGPYDYLDIFEAPNEESAACVSTIIRTFGHATTETWSAIPWDRFLGMMREMGKAEQRAR